VQLELLELVGIGKVPHSAFPVADAPLVAADGTPPINVFRFGVQIGLNQPSAWFPAGPSATADPVFSRRDELWMRNHSHDRDKVLG
jgi:hypothetical protein